VCITSWESEEAGMYSAMATEKYILDIVDDLLPENSTKPSFGFAL